MNFKKGGGYFNSNNPSVVAKDMNEVANILAKESM